MIDEAELLDLLKDITESTNNGLYHAFNNVDEPTTKLCYAVSELTIIDLKIKEILRLIEVGKNK